MYTCTHYLKLARDSHSPSLPPSSPRLWPSLSLSLSLPIHTLPTYANTYIPVLAVVCWGWDWVYPDGTRHRPWESPQCGVAVCVSPTQAVASQKKNIWRKWSMVEDCRRQEQGKKTDWVWENALHILISQYHNMLHLWTSRGGHGHTQCYK